MFLKGTPFPGSLRAWPSPPNDDRGDLLTDSNSQPQSSLGGWVQCLSTAFDSGLILLDETGEVSLANEVAARLLNRDLAMLQEDWPTLRREIDEQVAESVWKHGGKHQLRLSGPEGDKAGEFQVDIAPVDLENCRGHLIQFQDLIAVRASEKDRLLASQMRSIAHLYRSMAHDLRSPLNAMVVNLELLGDAVKPGASGPELEARRERYVDVLKQEMQRLNRRLRGFLSQTAPAQADRWRTFDVAEMIREMVLFVEPQAGKQKTELEVRLPDRPVEVHGNPDAIRQCLLSLLVNALAALEAQERPDGSGGRIEIGAHDVADQVVLWVADDGPGIPRKIADYIFDLHFTTKEDGSGIGLHVARETIENHGGELNLGQPEATQGSVFKIRLPARTDENPKESST